MPAQLSQSGIPINLTSSGALTKDRGQLIGYHVNSTSGGTIVFKDGGTSGTAVSGTITPTIGYQPFPCYFATAAGGFATIAGTIDVTFFVQGQ